MQMNDYQMWAARHPQAARELHAMVDSYSWLPAPAPHVTNETAAQQQVRLKVPEHYIEVGGEKIRAMSWRNNVGATPAKCEACGERQQPTRYGLANDSVKLNQQVKSSDLILAIPRLITQSMVGSYMAQFGSVECKPAGWTFTGKGREGPQANWLNTTRRLGGFAAFSTGDIQL